MIAGTLTFHVPPDASPEALDVIFSVLLSTEGGVSAAELRLQVAAILGKRPRGEAVALARDLELIDETGKDVSLTRRGKAIASESDAGDLIHTLSYFAWSSSAPERLSRMWTYRTVVDLLWEAAPARIDSELKKRLVENLLGRAETVFSGCDAFDPGRTSLGPKSIDGVLRWLEHLVPAVVLDNRMQRRQRCSPAMMALALAATAREAGVEAGTDFRLGPDQRAALGRACFLDPNALDAMLVWTVQTRPQSVRWGTMNARYGRQLVLHDLSPLL